MAHHLDELAAAIWPRVRTWTAPLHWWLLIPVMAALTLLFIDPAIRGTGPYDELVDVPFMAALFSAMVLHSGRRKAAIAAHNEVSRRNLELLERQREFVQNASHQLRTPISIALAHAELLQEDGIGPAGDTTPETPAGPALPSLVAQPGSSVQAAPWPGRAPATAGLMAHISQRGHSSIGGSLTGSDRTGRSRRCGPGPQGGAGQARTATSRRT